ncbi:MAG TPA: lipoprotein [Pseudomonas sp.]|jgi:predicted small lipoprotein YifL|nr:lipoprotein [Pseudomonas sp.]
MKRLLLPLLALIVLSAGLTGCGQKGPLYLPGEKGHSKDRFEI